MPKKLEEIKKETKPCFRQISIKEKKDKFISEGYIATTHPDRASGSDDTTSWEGDIVTEEMIDRIVNTINSSQDAGIPEAKYASYRHDWIKEQDASLPPAGIAIHAEKKQLQDGHFGAFVETEHLKTFPKYEDLKYDVEKTAIPGYSIEYETNNYDIVNLEGKNYRVLKDIDFYGYGFANARLQANPNAAITSYSLKELKEIIKFKELGDTMPQEKKLEKKEEAPKEEEKKEEVKEEEKKETQPEEKKEETEAKELTVSKEDYEKLQKLKQVETKETIDKEFKEKFKQEMKEMIKQDAPLINEGKKEFKELDNYKVKIHKEYKEIDDSFKHHIQDGQIAMGSHMAKAQKMNSMVTQQYKEAAEFGTKLSQMGVPVISNWVNQSMSGEVDVRAKERSTHVDVGGDLATGNPEAASPFAGTRLEVKESYWDRFEIKATALGAMNTTNTNVNLADASWTYGSYYQSPVELNDIYGPALINQLNDQTTTWGKLRKENWSGRSQIQFRARTARNATAGGYSEGTAVALTDFTGYIGKQKFQQPYSYYRVLVAVTGQMISLAQAPGGIGDAWGTEIKWSGVDLTKVLNQAIISTGDGTSESECLGFEALMVGATGTLYGKDISTYTTLISHQEGMSSARITIDQMRKMIQYCTGGDTTYTNSNANVADLVFFTSPTQERIIKGLIQDMQRTIPTSARIGYEGTLELDGVPVFSDPDYNTDDLFLVDTAHTKIAINTGPTIEFLPVAFDGKAAQIKIYFNLYSDAPTNNYWASGLATS